MLATLLAMEAVIVEDVDVEIAGRLFVLGAKLSRWESPETNEFGEPLKAGVTIEFTSVDEAPRKGDEYDLAAPLCAEERERVLALYLAQFEEAILDENQARAERAEERAADGQ